MNKDTGKKDMMLDLETLGLRPGCTVLSISAIVFDRYTGACGNTFDKFVSRDSCKELGLTEDDKTLNWWREQSGVAYDTVFSPTDPQELRVVLEDFTRWFQQQVQGTHMRVWANSPQFDMSILEHCFGVCEMQAPWKFWLLRDVRTIKDASPIDVQQAPEIPHVGLYDCEAQIVTVSRFFKQNRQSTTGYPLGYVIAPCVLFVALAVANIASGCFYGIF